MHVFCFASNSKIVRVWLGKLFASRVLKFFILWFFLTQIFNSQLACICKTITQICKKYFYGPNPILQFFSKSSMGDFWLLRLVKRLKFVRVYTCVYMTLNLLPMGYERHCLRVIRNHFDLSIRRKPPRSSALPPLLL